MGYSKVNVHEVEAAGPGGAVRFVRRELGVEAFGINWFELGPNVAGREHDETGSGQEEVVVVVRGSGVYRADGDDVPVREGDFLRFDPETTLPRRRAERHDAARGRLEARILRAARPVLANEGRPR